MSTGVEIGRNNQQLQAISVHKIILVSSVYDSFIFEGNTTITNLFISI